MFGYLKPDTPNLYMKDDVLFKSLYCGLCKSIGKICGQRARFTLSYDMAFMSAITHNILGVDIKINKENCVAHCIKKRPVAQPDEISLMLGAINVILAYYKVKDDILDEKKGGFKSSIIKKGYNKAKKLYPEFDLIIKNCYNDLLELEKIKSDSIDRVCEPFAKMLEGVSVKVFKEKATEYTSSLFYAIGKWIYLIDALDDYDKDVKKNNFNVLYNSYGCLNFNELISEHKSDLIFVFNTIFMQIAENYKKIETKYNTDLVVNILTRGIPVTTNKILLKGTKNDK